MAHEKPWYKRNGGEFVIGTLHMPMEARLAYSLLIDMMNDRDMPLPDDAEFICGFTKLSKRMWTKARDFLLNDKDAKGQSRIFIDSQGRLSNPRFARELAEREVAHERSVKAGSEGGKKSAAKRAAEQAELDLKSDFEAEKTPKRARKDDISASFRSKKDGEIEADAAKINDLGQPPPQASRAGASPRQSPESREEEEDIQAAAALGTRDAQAAAPVEIAPFDLAGLTDTFCRIAGVNNVSNPAAHVPVVKAWLDAGADPPMIDRLIKDGRDRATKPIRSLRYFDDKISEAIAKRDHPNENHRNGTANGKVDGFTAALREAKLRLRQDQNPDEP